MVSPLTHILIYHGSVPLLCGLFEIPCMFYRQQVYRCNNSYCPMNNSSHHLHRDWENELRNTFVLQIMKTEKSL